MGKIKLLPLFVLLFALAGCSLAQPEQVQDKEREDKFVGVYAVFGQKNIDYSHWVDYGSTTVDTEYGAFDFTEQVLFAEYDEETWRWSFPGLEGYSAFVTEVGDLSTGSDGLEKVSIAYKDKYCNRLEGTIFIEESDEKYLVTLYEVYETEDGRIYTNGYGNSSSSPANCGGAMTSRRENTYRENGEVVENYEFEVTVNFEAVTPTESLVLVQYDKNDVELCREKLSLEEQHITPNQDTAWMVVVETDKEGNCHRTSYEPPVDEDERVAHNFHIPNADGTIGVKTLYFDAIP